MPAIRVDDAVAWTPFDIPGGSESVQIARLHVERETRAQSILIRFPSGWRRPFTGYYEASEELVVLDGLLTMSGETYGPGDWAYLPAGYARRDTHAEPSVLAFARFGGPARWVGREPLREPPPMRAHVSNMRDLCPSPLGSGRAFALRDGAAWVLLDLPEGGRAPAAVELFAFDERVWARLDTGESLPGFEGPVFCRMVAEPYTPGEEAS